MGENRIGSAPARPRRSRLRLLLEIAETLNTGAGFEANLETVLASVAEEIDAAAVSLCVPQRQRDRPELRVSWATRGEGMKTALLEAELGLRDEVLRSGTPIRLEDARGDERFRGTVEQRFGFEPRALLAVPLRTRDQIPGVLFAVRERPDSFSRTDEVLLQAVADRLAAWVENDTLVRQLRQELEERELLLAVGREVGQTLELRQVLARIFDVLQPVVPYDAAAIFLSDSEGDLELGAQRGYADANEISLIPADIGIIGLAQREQQGVAIERVREHPDYVEIRASTQSEMAVPIASGGRIVGVINLESDREGAYSDRELRIAEMIASHVGSAIANARLHRSQMRALQVDHELGLAREIQLSLLPDRPPATERLELAAVNVPSSAVGGDYYDYLLLDDRHMLLILADVSGHGLSAALLTASMRTGFRLLGQAVREPADIAARLSEVLYDSSPANQYVAAVIALLDLESGLLRFTNAGHLPPLVLQGGEFSRMEGGGVPLGLFRGSRYESREIPLRPGALMALYTDGIPESENPDGEEFGLERVEDVLRRQRSAKPRVILQNIRMAVRRHRERRGGHIDDVTLVVARWLGPTPAASLPEQPPSA